MLVQLAATVGPADLRLVVVGDPERWDWVTWLPHVRSQARSSLVAPSDLDRLAELTVATAAAPRRPRSLTAPVAARGDGRPRRRRCWSSTILHSSRSGRARSDGSCPRPGPPRSWRSRLVRRRLPCVVAPSTCRRAGERNGRVTQRSGPRSRTCSSPDWTKRPRAERRVRWRRSSIRKRPTAGDVWPSAPGRDDAHGARSGGDVGRRGSDRSALGRRWRRPVAACSDRHVG